jgi:hypothetical protein
MGPPRAGAATPTLLSAGSPDAITSYHQTSGLRENAKQLVVRR